MASKTIRAFSVWPQGRPEWAETVNARSAGAAKYDRWRSIRECYQDVPITAMRCRVVGPPVTSEGFTRNAKYRGIPEVRCGDPVEVKGWRGTVVDHDSSCNLVILFDPGSPFGDGRAHIHPHDCTFPAPAPAPAGKEKL